MALGTIGSALAASAISAGVQYGASKLMGGGSSGSTSAPVANFEPMGFKGGGLRASFDPDSGGYVVRADPTRIGYVDSIAGLYGKQGADLGGLRARVAPGISDLREARLAEIEDARARSVGNLRDNLARRRVLGSSFGQDTIARTEAEFGGMREKAAAESFLQELDLTNNLLQQEFTAQRSAFQTRLDELNLQAEIASKLTSGATTQMGANARLLAELNAKEAAGAGRFFGQTFQPVFSKIGEGATALFKSGVGSGAGGGAYMMGSTPVPLIA